MMLGHGLVSYGRLDIEGQNRGLLFKIIGVPQAKDNCKFGTRDGCIKKEEMINLISCRTLLSSFAF